MDQTFDQLTQQIQAASKDKAKETNFQELLNSNIKFVASTFNDADAPKQGFICQNDVLPSDLGLNLVTEIRKLHTKAALLLSISADRHLLDSILLKSLTILIHPEGDPSVKVPHQQKMKGDQELMVRFKVQVEGVYLVAVRLYNHHIRQSPLLVPVFVDPDQGLAKLGLTVSSSDNPDSSIQSVTSELDTSLRVPSLRKPNEIQESETTALKPVSNPQKSEEKVVNDIKEIPPFKWDEQVTCLFEHKDGKKYVGHIDWRFRNNNGIPLYVVESVDKTVRATVGEEKLTPLSESPETSSAEVTFTKIPEPTDEKPEVKEAAKRSEDTVSYRSPKIAEPRRFKWDEKKYVATFSESPETPSEVTSPKIAEPKPEVKEASKRSEDSVSSAVTSVTENVAAVEFAIGQSVVAWLAKSWRQAVIHSIPSASLYIVKLAGGGFHGVTPTLLKPSKALDCANTTWKVGDFAIARWGQDNTWYNVKIIEKHNSNGYLVNFSDYGNQDVVQEGDMVLSSRYIPDGSCVDLNVNQDEESSEAITEVNVKNEPSTKDWEVKLKEKAQDKAVIYGVGSNIEVTLHNDHHKDPETDQVPDKSSSLECSLCSRCPPRKLYHLACDGRPVCWGCGVKQINVKHACWVCKAR